MPTLCFVMSLLWSVFFFLIALAMSTGFADEPGDTNGLRRFAVIFAIVVAPGIVATIFSHRTMSRRERKKQIQAHGFPIEPTARK